MPIMPQLGLLGITYHGTTIDEAHKHIILV